MIESRKGTIFESEAQTLVNTVNCCGVMGAGIALQFKKRFPAMFADYRVACRNGDIDIGKPSIWRSDEKWVLNFPTKLHFIQPSDLSHIDRGLAWIATYYEVEGIRSIAVPRLGAGLGGLKWAEVKALIWTHLAQLEDLTVLVYETQAVARRRKRPVDPPIQLAL